MAIAGATTITVTKIYDPAKRAYIYNDSTGRDISLITANIKAVHPDGASDEDSIYEMVDGTKYWGVETFTDTIVELSATDNTGS